MGKVLYTDFEGVEDIISSMMSNPQVKKAITRTNMYKFWENILPEKFKEKSKPYSMLPGGIMVVACRDSVVAQEMSLHKIMLIKKFEPFMKSVKMRFTDIKFDPKKWCLVEQSN